MAQEGCLVPLSFSGTVHVASVICSDAGNFSNAVCLKNAPSCTKPGMLQERVWRALAEVSEHLQVQHTRRSLQFHEKKVFGKDYLQKV